MAQYTYVLCDTKSIARIFIRMKVRIRSILSKERTIIVCYP